MRKHRSISWPGKACDNVTISKISVRWKDSSGTSSCTRTPVQIKVKRIKMDNISRFANAVSSLPLVDENWRGKPWRMDRSVSANRGRGAPLQEDSWTDQSIVGWGFGLMVHYSIFKQMPKCLSQISSNFNPVEILIGYARASGEIPQSRSFWISVK